MPILKKNLKKKIFCSFALIKFSEINLNSDKNFSISKVLILVFQINQSKLN